MKKSRYEELLENVKEAVAIHKGEKYAERIYRHEALNVAAIRKAFNFSQAKFASMLGISKRTLEGWEQGRRQPTGPARRLLEVAARFPDVVYRTIFDRDAALHVNADRSMTKIITRPVGVYFRAPDIRGTSPAPSPAGRTWRISGVDPAIVSKTTTVPENPYMQVQ